MSYTEDNSIGLDPAILASKVLADHKSGVCLIVHSLDRKYNHSTHWFDNLDTSEVINTSIEITDRAKVEGYTWSFYVLKVYDDLTGNVMCQDTTKSLNDTIESAKRIKEAF